MNQNGRKIFSIIMISTLITSMALNPNYDVLDCKVSNLIVSKRGKYSDNEANERRIGSKQRQYLKNQLILSRSYRSNSNIKKNQR